MLADRQQFSSILGKTFSILALLLHVSCGYNSGPGLKRHDLFEIHLGTLPGQMDWFYQAGFHLAGTADIKTRDGLVFVSGGETGKLMVFNSYGDLLTYVYNKERNPALASSESGEGNRSISRWPFRSMRSIASYDDGFLVDDGVGPERRIADAEFGAFYDRVVLRFSQNGEYLGHLGKEGLGGSPFPYISTIDVREDGGIVVTCRTPDMWLSYWYSKEGHPITTVRIQKEQLPVLQEGVNIAVYSVRPDPVEWTLHIRLDVYSDDAEGNRPDPRLYTLNLSDLQYSEPIILPYSTASKEKDVPAVPPDYLGTTVGGIHVMLAPEGFETYRLTLVDGKGRIIQNRRLRIDADTTVYRQFYVQNDGLLTGIFVGSDGATVSWWRVDKLIRDKKISSTEIRSR